MAFDRVPRQLIAEYIRTMDEQIYGFGAKYICFANDEPWYETVCPKCGEKDIMTPWMMKEHKIHYCKEC